MQNNPKRRTGRVIPFERDGDFFLRRGSQRLERNNLLDAISNYHLAQSRDPQNTEIQLAIAEVLTEMHRYEQSNRLLFPLLSVEESPPECFFGIACNFLGMQEFSYAQDSLESYLALDPEGDFVGDALEMLDVIEDEGFLYTMPGIHSKEEREALRACALGRQMLENGQIKEAVLLLEEAVEKYPDTPFVHNNLALACFCNKDYANAMACVERVLQDYPDDVQAHCNLLLFMHAARDEHGVEQTLDFLSHVQTDDPQDWNRMAVVFMEMGHMETALPILKRLLSMFPYDEGTLHRLGVCYYHLEQYRKALDCYDRLLKVDPGDTIAAYYRKICRRALDGAPEKIDWLYHYQVPFPELLNRVRQINEISRLPRTDIEARWKNDKEFRALLAWSLHLPDISTKRTLLSLIATFGNYEAEQILRHFQLDQMQPDSVKQDVFAMLKHMNAKEPYIAYLQGGLVQSRVQLQRHSGRLPIAYQRALELCVSSMQSVRPNACVLAGIELFQNYITKAEPLPKLRAPQISAFAAALEYLACKKSGEEHNKAQIAAHYSVSQTRMNNALLKLQRHLDITP